VRLDHLLSGKQALKFLRSRLSAVYLDNNSGSARAGCTQSRGQTHEVADAHSSERLPWACSSVG
jgi:hypothetical protein